MLRYLKENKLLLAVAIILGAFSSVASAFISIILQKIIDIALAGNLSGFYKVLIFTVIYMVVLCLVAYAASLVGKYLLRNIIQKIRSNVFNGIMHRNPEDFSEVNTADYLSALTNDVKMVEENYLIPLLSAIELIVMFLATLGILLYLSPIVTGCLILGMAIMFIVPIALGKALEKRQDKVSQQLSTFTAKAKDLFSGYEVIRCFQVLPYTKAEFSKENTTAANTKLAADKLFALNEGLSGMLSSLITVIVVFVAAYLVLQNSITVGTLIALVQLSGTFMMPIIMLMEILPKIKGVAPIINRLNDFTDYKDTNFQGTAKPQFTQNIAVKNLTFSYTQNHKAVEDLNITFEKGKKYAILGPSGCGKTTLIKLLTAYSPKYSGSISYDNAELHTLDIAKTQELSAVIHQNIYMFDTTIGENIAMFGDYTQAEWADALKYSGVSLFLPQTKNGLKEPVGENGSNLSGGQRQRIAVARALMKKTPILILDEGTSAIDRQTAMEIETALLTKDELTLITITHIISEAVLKQYDEIIYMENGTIIQKGNLEELTKADSPFAKFFANT
ncbi:MAG: ABC transporter ATP-binding protein [Clostridiales bacterium]